MKVLKFVGIAIVTVIAIFFILALIAPSEYAAERSVVIDAPKEIVFNKVKYWGKWEEWSPWKEMDPSMKITVEGEDGTVGSKYLWVGDPQITGTGEMTNTGMKENEELKYQLYFILPYESSSDGYVRLSDEDGKTKVSWGFYGKFPFPLNIMLLFMDMQENMKEPFDRGLELLKKKSEEEYQKSKVDEMEVKEVE